MEDDGPPGVPEWVVTYGDMMSLLLTFFIMLVSLSEVVADKKYRAILEAARKQMGYHGGPLAPPGKNFPLNSVVESLQDMQLGSPANEDQGSGGVKNKGPQGKDIRVTRLREGDSKREGNPIPFAEGDAELTDEALRLIDEIAVRVAGKPQKLEIRSFTSPFVEGVAQSSDERMKLGYERGEKVLQELLKQRIDRDRLRIAVYFHNPVSVKESEVNPLPNRVEISIYDEFAETFRGRAEDYR